MAEEGCPCLLAHTLPVDAHLLRQGCLGGQLPQRGSFWEARSFRGPGQPGTLQKPCELLPCQPLCHPLQMSAISAITATHLAVVPTAMASWRFQQHNMHCDACPEHLAAACEKSMVVCKPAAECEARWTC